MDNVGVNITMDTPPPGAGTSPPSQKGLCPQLSVESDLPQRLHGLQLGAAPGGEACRVADMEGAVAAQMRARVSRSPRRRVEDEQYIHSVSQCGLPALRNRRRSDPGRISVSPLRARVRIESAVISEDGDQDGQDELSKLHPRLVALRTGLTEGVVDAADEPWTWGRSRSRSPHTPYRMRAERSMSLPGMDLEVGEAIGALALRPGGRGGVAAMAVSPSSSSSSSSSASSSATTLAVKPGGGGGFAATLSVESAEAGGPPRRRRSVSVECSPLEAISEEDGLGPARGTAAAAAAAAAASRRYSTPHVNTTNITTAM